jgi:hypothetical protein
MTAERPWQSWSLDRWSCELRAAAAARGSAPEAQGLQRAARAIYQVQGGRPEDPRVVALDRRCVAEARLLLETGQVQGEWSAFMKIAAGIPGASQRSIAARLRRRALRDKSLQNTFCNSEPSADCKHDSKER